MEAVRTTEQRAVALLHDTVLNDLALIINGPEVLDPRTTKRMLDDVHDPGEHGGPRTPSESKPIVDPSDGSLRNQMTQLVSDFQWRGLNVEFTGDTGGVAHMTPSAVAAAVGRAARLSRQRARPLGRRIPPRSWSARPEIVRDLDGQRRGTRVRPRRGPGRPAGPAVIGVRRGSNPRAERSRCGRRRGTAHPCLFTLPLLPTDPEDAASRAMS